MYVDRILKTYSALKSADYVLATGKFSLWSVWICKWFRKRPSVAIVHGSEVNLRSSFLRSITDRSLKSFRKIIAVSNYTSSLIAHLQKEVHVIPNGIDMSQWSSIREPEVSLKGNPSLITVGRVSSRKGQLNVIKHIPNLIEQYPDLHYHCVGIPTEAEAFMVKAKELGVDDQITFHGSVSDAELKTSLQGANIFVMLSTESSDGDVEGFGIAILEANASGLPSIGSKGCGIEDAIKPEYSGILVEPDDSEAFKSAISTILNDRITYSENAKKWAQTHGWSDIIKDYIQILEDT